MDKPELGEITVGRELLVIPPTSRYHSNDPVRVVVTKVGRKWIDLERAEKSEGKWPKTWHMHIDTRAEYRPGDPSIVGSSTSHARFRSPEEHAWYERESQARQFLEGAGIQTNRWGKSGRYEGRELELANVIRRHEGLPEL